MHKYMIYFLFQLLYRLDQIKSQKGGLPKLRLSLLYLLPKFIEEL